VPPRDLGILRARPQRTDLQVGAQLAAGLEVKAFIDRLVRHAHLRAVRMIFHQGVHNGP